jgi:hypothetical protein
MKGHSRRRRSRARCQKLWRSYNGNIAVSHFVSHQESAHISLHARINGTDYDAHSREIKAEKSARDLYESRECARIRCLIFVKTCRRYKTMPPITPGRGIKRPIKWLHDGVDGVTGQTTLKTRTTWLCFQMRGFKN